VEAGLLRPIKRNSLFLFLLAFILFAAACGGATTSPEATATYTAVAPEPTVTPSPVPQANPIEPDGERIMAHVRHLADVIGPRPAGTSEERAAADYLAEHLRSYGYEVELQSFPVVTESSRSTRLSVISPNPRSLPSVALARSGSGNPGGLLVPSGIGRPAEFPANVRGNIALVERGELVFQDKVRNAEQAGAVAVIIFNNEPGGFFGTLSSDAAIPAISISQEDGRALLTEASGRAVQVEVAVEPAGSLTSHNVVARPPGGGGCETISGGHYDSVPGAPGASDNASGTAAVLEIAMVIARNGGMGNHCFVLFGAEELGLFGSRAFVAALSSAERQRIKAMFNYDMVGVGESWLLIGDPALQDRAATLAARLGIETTRGQLGNNSSSDHASFISAGIPAFMLHRITDRLLHTPQDVSSRVRPELLEEAARLGVALLESIANES
jgi:aminopeptidase YwaD